MDVSKDFSAKRFAPLVSAALLAALAAASSHALTAADSGWVPVWNGQGFPAESFYIYSGAYHEVAEQADKFKVEPGGTGGIIHTTAGYSLLTTKKEYGYYKVRVDYKFKDGTTGGNAGLMILMDNTAAKTVKTSTRPRSIEINCRRDGNYPWSLWAGRGYGPYMTTTIKAGTEDQYLPGGTLKTMNITEDNNRVIRSANPDNELPGGQWNHGEAWIYGDSGVFYLNGQLRTSSWGWVTKQGDPSTKTASGGIAVQAEGTEVWYTKWEVMELDPFPPYNPIHTGVGDRFTIRKPYPSRPVLSLDCGGLEAILREAPTGEGFQWLDVYTSRGRRVTSLKRSESDPARFQWNDAGRGLGTGPYLVRWSGGK
jgi:hypothetical protein